jgi:hypothetical protein
VKINWMIAGKVYECEREKGACPFCGAIDSVVELPEPISARQPDGTTHVCHPGLDGCNHGFARAGHVPPPAESEKSLACVGGCSTSCRHEGNPRRVSR